MSPSVLIVEDDVVTAKSLSGFLTAAGFISEHVSNGPSALSAAAIKKFDAILLDIMMPGMDGFEVLTRLRAVGVSTPVIFISGKSDLDHRVHGLDLGGDAFIS